MMELLAPVSALSPAVSHLVCRQGCCVEQLQSRRQEGDGSGDSASLTDEGRLNVYVVASRLLELPGNRDSLYYEKAVSALGPLFVQSQLVLKALSDAQIEERILPKLHWMSSEKVLCDCLEILRDEDTDGSRDILVLLLLSAVLERSLGNVCVFQGSQCPSLLKDLLVNDGLANILGDNVLQILQVIIGPPTSLNLRNLAWHGFFGDQELSRGYCCFLLLLASNVGDILSEKGISFIPRRPFFTWSQDVKKRMVQPSRTSDDATTLENLRTLLKESKLICPQTERQWQLVFHLCDQGRRGYCLALLLPLFEHCLRRAFATVNCCPERVLTAQSSEFYTTFNEMLEQTLPSGERNKLPEFLTAPCMDLLHDLLFYPEGPRVRDHLSHGQMDFASVEPSAVHPFLCVLVFVAWRLLGLWPPWVDEHSEVKIMFSKVENYRSVFHPMAILQQKFADLLYHLDKTEHFIHVTTSLHLLASDERASKLCEDNELWTKTLAQLTSLWQDDRWSRGCLLSLNDLSDGFRMRLEPLQHLSQEHIPTLFRWQTSENLDVPSPMKESEFVGLLSRITEECTVTVEQTQGCLHQKQQQLTAKGLRSRQRENLKKLLTCLPCLQVLMTVVAAVVGRGLQVLPLFNSFSCDQRKAMQKHLKLVLQGCENTRTYTSCEKNKWTESVELLFSLLPKCQQLMANLDCTQH